MSDINVDDDLVRDFLAECHEHLATIENDLLEMEQAGAQIDEHLVNRVFRAAHSIKGGAGFFNLTKIRELAHKTESVLDLVRSRRMVPTPDIVSILLLSFDKLRELLDGYAESNQADIGEFTSALERLTSDNLPADQKTLVKERVSIVPTQSGGVIDVSALDLSQARRGGKSVYLIRYDLIHDIQRLGKTPYPVLKNLMTSGTILETGFDLESAGTLETELSNQLMLQVLYCTALGPELIQSVVEVPIERVSIVDKSGALRPLGGPEAYEPAVEIEPEPPPAALPEPASRVDVPPPPAPVAAPAPAPVKAKKRTARPASPNSKPAAAAAAPVSDSTIRLNVTLLDSLMTLAGELVLSRNQLNESLARGDQRGIGAGAQRISMVTSELQEVVTLTRMQPVGVLFNKFPRVVRDLAHDLGKEVQLEIEGAQVELDKTILEGLSDPLTHMVRNAVDHGIESPESRMARRKPPTGTVTLRASHQAGQVVIEVSDDGKGLDAEKVAASTLAKGLVSREQLRTMTDREKIALIMLPGVSTAETINDVSGRGVGMDVVKTNLDKLGGKIEIDSAAGRGTSFRIKLPLTLAIIPSLLVSDGGQRFAIPQINVGELIRIPPNQIAKRVDRVGEAEILTLRDRLVPLVHLADTFGSSRAGASGRAWNVVLVDAGAFEYGLVVEDLHDTVEIVVKPLGRHLKGIADYAGATILGDGRVSVILDVAGLATRAGLSALSAQELTRKEGTTAEATEGEAFPLLLFENAIGEACAVPIDLVSRIERVRPEQIEYLGGRRTMQYRGSSLPVVALADVSAVGQLDGSQSWVVIVFEHAGWAVGLLAAEPLDMIEANLTIDRATLKQRGIAGSAVIKGRTTLIVEIHDLVETVRPEQVEPEIQAAAPEPGVAAAPVNRMPTILLAEDSDFFRSQIKRLIEAVGYQVIAAEDGQAAWELLEAHSGEINLVTTDLEMPRLDGLSLTRKIRADERFGDLPVIAITTLAGEEEIARGLAAGVTEYQIKLNKDDLLDSIRRVAAASAHVPA